jgi:hypothetical protein
VFNIGRGAGDPPRLARAFLAEDLLIAFFERSGAILQQRQHFSGEMQ